jgi:hypothetical protein
MNDAADLLDSDAKGCGDVEIQLNYKGKKNEYIYTCNSN